MRKCFEVFLLGIYHYKVMNEKETISSAALVLQGGGSRGAFTAGVLDVLMEHDIVFPYVIGTSAGGLNAVNYVSGDIGRSRYVSTELMRDPKFVSFRNILFRGTAFNFTYLFHTIPKTKCPFNQGQYNSSPIEFLVASVNLDDGTTHYFKKEECKEFYKALASTASLPIISRPVRVEGGRYLDGGVTCAVPFQKPLDDGFSKIVIVQTREEGYRKKPTAKKKLLIAKMLYHHCPKFHASYRLMGDTYNKDMDEMERLAKEGKAFIIRPDEKPDVRRIEKDKGRLLALYEKGREIMERELPAMLDFIGVSHE